MPFKRPRYRSRVIANRTWMHGRLADAVGSLGCTKLMQTYPTPPYLGYWTMKHSCAPLRTSTRP